MIVALVVALVIAVPLAIVGVLTLLAMWAAPDGSDRDPSTPEAQSRRYLMRDIYSKMQSR